MSSSDDASVTGWLGKLKSGHTDVAQQLWCRYVERLVRLANRKLGNSPRRVADEEDVAIVAFNAFLQGVEAGRFSKLDDRDDLWQILVMLTERKATDQIRAELAAKRGKGAVRGDSVFHTMSGSNFIGGFGQIVDAEPTPEFALQVSQQLQSLLGQLQDPVLEQIAIAKMDGYTNAEIAKQVVISMSGVERKLGVIRRIWGDTDQ